MSKPRVLTIAGTRPELIRLSRLIPRLDKFFDHRFIFTSQNFTPELKEIFFRELEIREPDQDLAIPTDSLGSGIGAILQGVEVEIKNFAPHGLVVLGDTNSGLGLYMGKRMRVTTFHLEAGNRCFDDRVPEEVNRRLLDHISDYNLAYTEYSRRNLIREGLGTQFVGVSGSPLGEVFSYYRNNIETADSLSRFGLVQGEFILASLHRFENISDEVRLGTLFRSLATAAKAFGVRVVLSGHPSTVSQVEKHGIQVPKEVEIIPPFGFFDYVALQKASFCTVSDSGSLSEESVLLNRRSVLLRDSTERQEALESGHVILSGTETQGLLTAISVAAERQSYDASSSLLEEYRSTHFSQRVLNFISSGIANLDTRKRKSLE